MINCRKATRLLSDKLERKLLMHEKILLKAHTLMCKSCRYFGEQMLDLRGMSQAFTKETDSESTDTSPTKN